MLFFIVRTVRVAGSENVSRTNKSGGGQCHPPPPFFRWAGSEAQVDRGRQQVAVDARVAHNRTVVGLLVDVVHVPAHAGAEAARRADLVGLVVRARQAAAIAGFTLVGGRTNGPGTCDVVGRPEAPAFLVASTAGKAVVVLGIGRTDGEAGNADRTADGPGGRVRPADGVRVTRAPAGRETEVDTVERLAVARADVEDVVDGTAVAVHTEVVGGVTGAARRVGCTDGQAVEGRREVGDALHVVVARNLGQRRQGRLAEAARTGHRDERRGRTRVERHRARVRGVDRPHQRVAGRVLGAENDLAERVARDGDVGFVDADSAATVVHGFHLDAEAEGHAVVERDGRREDDLRVGDRKS